MAVTLRQEGAYASHITRSPGARPTVESVRFYPSSGADSAGMLEKMGKEVHANRYAWTTLLPSNEYQLLSVDAPTVAPAELKTAIRWRLKDMLDFHIDDATIDVLDIPMDKNAPVRNRAMYAVVARNQFIRDRQALFADAKIPLRVIDIPELAQRNLSALLEPEGRGVAFLSFDDQGGLLTITFSGELYLSRRIEVSMADLQQADADQRTAVYDRIVLELQRSLDHFDRQYHFIALSKMILSVSGETGAGLQAHLGENLYVPVEQLNLESVLDLSKVPELLQPERQQRYLMTLGCALRHEEKTL